MFLINVVLIGFMVARPKMPPRGNSQDLKQIISKKLNLDKEQQETYFELAKIHYELIAQIGQKQKPLIRDYFSALKHDEQNLDVQDSLLSQINQFDRDKLVLTYTHFEDLKKVCNPEQLLVFEGIMDEIIQVLVGGQKKIPPPPRD